MAKPSGATELRALKNLISEVDLILSTTALPQNRTARSRELLRAAVALTEDLIRQTTTSKAAALLGSKGGSTTAKRGSEYFRQLAAKRKTRAGGRPRKKTQ
jgi:hypothetical protein